MVFRVFVVKLIESGQHFTTIRGNPDKKFLLLFLVNFVFSCQSVEPLRQLPRRTRILVSGNSLWPTFYHEYNESTINITKNNFFQCIWRKLRRKMQKPGVGDNYS
jgi:hypothetical protein